MQYKKLKEQSNCKVNSLRVVERYLRELHYTGETVRVEESNTQLSGDDGGSANESSEKRSKIADSELDSKDNSSDNGVTES